MDISKTRLALTLLIGLLVVVCVVDIKQQNKEIEVVIPQTEYTATAGVVKAMNDIHADTRPIVKVEEVDLTQAPEPQWVEMDVPSNNSFKSYMDYRKVTDIKSEQYAFLQICEDSACGIMLSEGRYCIAVGSYYTTEIGTRIDLVMENSSIVPCIVAECKNNDHTDTLNQQHLVDKSVIEFVVNVDNLSDYVRYTRGDCSFCDPRLEGEISSIRVYLEN